MTAPTWFWSDEHGDCSACGGGDLPLTEDLAGRMPMDPPRMRLCWSCYRYAKQAMTIARGGWLSPVEEHMITRHMIAAIQYYSGGFLPGIDNPRSWFLFCDLCGGVRPCTKEHEHDLR